MTRIPIADPVIGEAERERVDQLLADGQLADGPEVRAFEDEFAAYCEANHGVATGNGTAALHAALDAVGIDTGDRVITTPFSFVATANAIRHCGATPVFADIDPETFTLDPAAVEATIRELDDADAILPVHLYGLPADMDPLLELADTFDLPVVEDAAQAHGAEYRGRRVGTIGDAGCFSFYPTKNMTTGEGGMVVTDRDDVASRVRRFVNHGRTDAAGHGYDHVEVGYNYRMTSLAAAIGRAQLDRLPEFTRARREHASILTGLLTDRPGVHPPVEPPDRKHVYHQYTITATNRGALRSRLDDAGIGNAVYYPTPIHRQPAYDGRRSFPEAERAARDAVSVPVHPSLTPAQVRAVGDALLAPAVADGGIHDG